MYICIPSQYNKGEIYGSWNDWKEPLNINEFDFSIEPYIFFSIDTVDSCISYKIKIDDKYELITQNGYLTINEDKFENNFINSASIISALIIFLQIFLNNFAASSMLDLFLPETIWEILGNSFIDFPCTILSGQYDKFLVLDLIIL